MKTLIKAALVLMALPAFGETISLTGMNAPSDVVVTSVKTRGAYLQEVNFNLNTIDAAKNPARPQFTVLSAKNISFTQNVGSPALPYKSLVVAGKPSELDVIVDKGEAVEFEMISSPAQKEISRNQKPQSKDWKFSKNDQPLTTVEYLGKYRGQDLSRVTIIAAESDFENGVTRFFPNLKATMTSSMSITEAVKAETDAAYDYLIVTPSSLLGGLHELVDYKTREGHKVKVVKVEDIGNDVAKLTAYFKSEYAANNYKYALIVGTDTAVVNHKVNTSGSAQTPSDYPYYLMDANDMIPDVQYARVVASSSDEVARQVKKWISYSDRSSNASAYLKMIGIASNEGSSPSDEEYVVGIESDMKAAYGTTATHFAQNSPTSKPDQINAALNQGIGYLVYLGHGSGTSWGSTGSSYSNSSVKQLANSKVTQPIIIDVACANGGLKKGLFGETWMNATDSSGGAIGSAMYYGGTVNISWHPPAIMARGMVKKAVQLGLDKVGDVIFAGQLYLLENHTDKEAVRDNYEWYHLFGEPSAPFHFR